MLYGPEQTLDGLKKRIGMTYQGVKRKIFISHYKGDKNEVEAFIDEFANRQGVFTPYVLGANDNDEFIDSTDTDYVMTQIRRKYLLDTTVTIVLVGSCTHSRRYVDWEIKTSLRRGEYTPNGLMGIVSPSQQQNPYLPPRLDANLARHHVNCYARYWEYPKSGEVLGRLIEDAYEARTTRAELIVNTQDMMKKNVRCKICGVTH